MKFSILNTGKQSAKENMDLDRHFLETLDPSGNPILHLYDWKKLSLTYGHFAKPEKLLDFEGIKKHHIDHARRVTGGGVTLHFSDLAFSFFMPIEHPLFSENTLENYAFVNKQVIAALRAFIKEEKLGYFEECDVTHDERSFFCMAKPTRYDVMIEGKKVGGAAQRKTKRGYLHHGTLSLAAPNLELLRDVLFDKEKVYNAIIANSYYLYDSSINKSKLDTLREEVTDALIEAFKKA